MKTFTTIPEYCRAVNIPEPVYPFYDIRKFEDKVRTENQHQDPFRRTVLAEIIATRK